MPTGRGLALVSKIMLNVVDIESPLNKKNLGRQGITR